MVAEADAAVLAFGGDDLGERSLALLQRRLAQVEAIEIEEIEGVEDEIAALAGLQRLDEGGEAGDAGLRLHHDLGVDERRLHRQAGDGFRDGGEAFGPIETGAGAQSDAAVLYANLHAVAVVLDLMHPVGARGRLFDRGRERGLDERRQRAGPRLRQFRRIDGGLELTLLLLALAAALRRPDTVLLARDLFHVAAGGGRTRHLLQDVGRALGPRRLVIRLEQQPRLLLLARLARHAHEMPGALQLLALEAEFQMALAVAEFGVGLGRPGAAVPHHDGAAAILAFGDDALEIAVFERMVFDVDGEALLAGDEARSFRHRPALEHAVELEAEVVVQAAGGMLLDDIGVAGLALALLSGRLRRFREVTLRAIGVERLV